MASGLPILPIMMRLRRCWWMIIVVKPLPARQEQRFVEMISELPKQQQLDQMRLAAGGKGSRFFGKNLPKKC